jgi:predicted DNA-binding WGR domain protein
MTLLRRRDPALNMARFYRLRIQLAFFDNAADLIREWGRIGSPGQVRADHHPDAEAAAQAAAVIERLKRRKGYG